ncbi:MAG TPA: VOC family protein [Ktedonosporobacter sp.]|nr:VOC family protein [Ktedonosporobacter sp.]
MTSIYQRKGLSLPRLHHVSLPIPDGTQESIRTFYSKVLGLTEKPVPHTLRHRGLVWFAAGDGEMELHFVPDTYLSHPAEARHFCLEVDDVEEYRKRLVEAGCQIVEADPIPHRPRFFFLDPVGNHIEFTTIEGDYQAE